VANIPSDCFAPGTRTSASQRGQPWYTSRHNRSPRERPGQGPAGWTVAPRPRSVLRLRGATPGAPETSRKKVLATPGVPFSFSSRSQVREDCIIIASQPKHRVAAPMDPSRTSAAPRDDLWLALDFYPSPIGWHYGACGRPLTTVTVSAMSRVVAALMILRVGLLIFHRFRLRSSHCLRLHLRYKR
jgi:hypothetical protein